jgi:DNA-binding transcriptional LysR family regulator
MSHGTPELSDREADCFITVEKDKRGFSFDALYHEKLFPVCSRSFWAKMKADLAIDSDIDMKAYLKHCPEWLANYPLITSFSIYEQYTEDWRLWFLNQSKKLPEQAKFHNFSHLMLAYEAAKYHQGIALVNDYMVNKYNFDIELIKLPCSSYDTGDQFSFGYKTSRRGELAIQQLRQWIRQQSLSLQEL